MSRSRRGRTAGPSFHLLLTACLCSFTSAFAGEQATVARQLDLQSFDQIWTTVRDQHWDPDLGGLDWQAVREELRPRVAAAPDRDTARQLMQMMLDRLGHSHFLLLATGFLGALDAAADDPVGGDGETGIDLRLIDGVAVVASVAAGSPAAAAGVRAGWIVESVGGELLAPVISQVLQGDRSVPGRELLLIFALRTRLQGAVDDTVQVTFRDGAERQQRLQLDLVEARGERVRLGHLPAMSVWFEWRLLDARAQPFGHPAGDGSSDKIGYIAFSSFFDPASLMPQFAEAVQTFMDEKAKGVVIDLRGNPGGIGAMAMGMAGWFIDEKGCKLGTMKTRDADLNFVVFPRGRTFAGNLAVLVDGLSASTAEIFAGGLQDLGRAVVLGSRTAGMALPSRVDRLPNGDSFQYAFAEYLSTGGASLEGHGVVPDRAIQLTRQALLEGRDPILEAAVALIAEQRQEEHQHDPENRTAAPE